MLDFLSEALRTLFINGGGFRLPPRKERTAGFWITRLLGAALFALAFEVVWFIYLRAFSQP